MKRYSEEFFIDLYFRYGSVEEVFKSYEEYLPISLAQFHRLVAKKGLVKSAGRHTNLPELLHFFKEKALTPGTPIEKLYKSMPHDFRVSLTTIHRTYKAIQDRTFRRHGAALILVDDKNNILVGKETHSNSRYGKKIGDWAIPMGFAKKNETDYESALRIAQHEVSPEYKIPKKIKPFMFFDLVDVRIKVYLVKTNKNFEVKTCQSYRLTNHKFINVYDLLEQTNLREGVKDIIKNYISILDGVYSNEVVYETANINKIIEMGSSQRLALNYSQ